MWRAFSLFVLLLVCLFSIKAQTVIENESSIVLNEKTADVLLVIENKKASFNSSVSLEILDSQDVVRAKISSPQMIKSGRESYKLSLPLGDLLEKNQADISWFRLRYKVGETRGIVSLSQIVKDIFEVRVIASDNLLTGMTYRSRIRTINPFNNQTVQGVKVNADLSLELKDEKKLTLSAHGETDSEGFAELEFQIPVDVNLDNDGDNEIKVTGKKNGIIREATEDLQTLGDDYQFPMMADKPIYQPEQTLNVRGILLKGTESKTVVTDSEVEFRVEDEEETVLYREKVKTSAFGVASMSWQIPENAKLGQYRIRVKNQNTSEGYYVGYQTVKVSRYDLPNFAVNAKALKAYYLPNENQAEVEVSADYLFGKPVTKGKVRVVRENERKWNWKEQKYDIDEGESHDGKTDENGKFTAKFDLEEDHDDLKDSNYYKFRDLTFTAYFTDLTTNRTEQRRFDVRVTKEPIHVYFIGNEGGNSASLPVNAYVSAFYADGSPCLCNVELKGREDDTKDKFKTLLKTKTNSLGGGKLSFMRPKFDDVDDDLDIQIIAKDKKGLTGTYADDDGGSYYDKEIRFDELSKLEISTEKTIFKPGEAVKINLNAVFEEDKEQPSAKVYIDVVKDWSVVESYFVTLKNGKGELKIPYQPKFEGVLKIAAYFEEEKTENRWNYQTRTSKPEKYIALVKTTRGIIFPHSENLKLDAKFDKATYKPAEDAKASFSVLDSLGKAVESVLGVVIFDKAVEERARTEGDFNGTLKSYYDWLGYGDSFGGINVKDINELDLSKPISAEMQLAAEIMLYDENYYPNIFRSQLTATDAKSVYAGYFKKQFDPLEKKLLENYNKNNYEHPTDTASFNKILTENGVVFEDLRDPWGQNYRAVFELEKTNDILRIISAGADKKFDTDDDFTVSSQSFVYFTPIANKIDKAVKDFHERTGSYIRDEKTLFQELGISELKDRFDRPYRIFFQIQNRYFSIRIHSDGKDGKYDSYYYSDDFDVHNVNQDYFKETELKINQILQTAQKIPMTETELKSLLKQNGVDPDEIRDGWGEKISFYKREFSRYEDVVKEEIVSEYGKEGTTTRKTITPVTRGYVSFTLRSKGADKKENSNDDFNFAEFAKVIWEQSKDDQFRRLPTENYPYAQGTSSISGTIKDVAGVVISRAQITLTDEKLNTRTVVTDEDGKYLFSNIMPLTYTIKIEAKGFKTKILENITASVNTLLTGDFVLEVDPANGSPVYYKPASFSNRAGTISGTVTDASGAAVAGATVTATNTASSDSRSTVTNENGKYLIGNLTAGTYNLKVDASGFKSSVIQNVPVTADGIVKNDFALEVGTVSEVVNIEAAPQARATENFASEVSVSGARAESLAGGFQVDGASGKENSFALDGQEIAKFRKSNLGQNEDVADSSQKSTPKLREYFPETLLWQPELITDKDGKAQLTFKMADSITTWKLYTIASTKNGKFGVAEKEVTEFQPFFVDLDPPKFLTEGDEIYLPTQVRNYTPTKQKVDVTMSKSDWFSFLESEPRAVANGQAGLTKKIEVDKNAASNAVFGFKTLMPIKDGKQRVTAITAKDSDAIEKPVTVRPNGEEIVHTDSRLFSNSAQFEVNFPQNALPKTPKAELKIYPNLLAHVTESVEGLLERPYGCGEQTVSSTYPNLMILKFINDDSPLKRKAKKYLKSGYERLLGYQVADGGFSYWGGKDESNLALTAYALRFLNDAKEFIEVDEKVIENAADYLIKQQHEDGSFYKKYRWETSQNDKAVKTLTTYVARTLAMLKADKPSLDKALAYLKKRNAEIDEPYALALYGLASFDAGNIDEAKNVAKRLSTLAKNEDGAVYWNLESNTPFYGWGTAGRIETTALVVQLLWKIDWQPGGVSRELPYSELGGKGMLFLLKNKDRYGVWYSTQTTINVLDAFLQRLSTGKEQQTISVKLNGEKLKDYTVSADQIEPIIVPLTDKLANTNSLEISTSNDNYVNAQVIKTHYVDWKDSVSTSRNVNDSRAIRLDYKCDKLNVKIMETVNCTVEAERIGFQGYGMLLAEIGIPPGADVSRESLEKAFEGDWSLSRYDVLPDRIVVYMWSKSGGTKFNFSFKPRYGINAQTPMSIVYDYYNEESRGVVSPLKFEVK